MMKAAKLPPAPKTPLEKALKTVKSDGSLTIIGTLTRNVAQNPREEKYRRLRLTNQKIADAILHTEGALETMLQLGWTQERLRAQLEADKRERAARGPVTQGSRAVQRSMGANVRLNPPLTF
eukprot:9484092-Pyramimonas_sp.AAC.2